MKQIHYVFWIVFTAWVGLVLYFGWHSQIFALNTPLAFVKGLVWLAFGAFTIFTYRCSSKENFVKSVKRMGTMYWGWQVGIDLYIGLSMFLLMIYLHTGSGFMVLLWVLPTIMFGNLATLLYLAIYFDSIIAKFLY
jgi:hypothetical protein